ncbi:hypothetical protein AG0111_0g8446 [Alternaria gaisen]|uniref:Uncharacterized protein n=1 Tax=Alternaria gaisen TaxID=167740 RepID=A0ACB6FH57_9PLEO|nr:hypothetical protein AG0111_0g8446 [Alternaria gaisen]
MDINRVPGFRPTKYPIPSSSDEEEQEATAENRAQSTELKEETDAHADTLVLLQRLQYSEHRMAELLALVLQLSDALGSSACDVDATLERNSLESYDWCKTKTLREDFPKDSPVIPQAIVIPNAKGASYGASDVFKRTQGYRDLANQEDSDGGSGFVSDKLSNNTGSSPTSAIDSDQEGPDEMLAGLLKEVKATKSNKATDLTYYLKQRRLELANTDPVNREQNINKNTSSDADSDSESKTYESKKKLNSSGDEASSTKSTSVSVKPRKRMPARISGLSSTKQPPARPGKRQKRSTSHSIKEEGTNSDSSRSDDQRVMPPRRARKPYANSLGSGGSGKVE